MNDLHKLFPNASRDVLARNGQGARETAELERRARKAAQKTAATEEANADRFLVRITSVRLKLIDPDNICEKYMLDCCRYAGLIHDDSARVIDLETRQRKAGKGEEEHTMIEVFALS